MTAVIVKVAVPLATPPLVLRTVYTTVAWPFRFARGAKFNRVPLFVIVAVPFGDVTFVIVNVSPVAAGVSLDSTLKSAAAASSVMVKVSPTTTGGGTAGDTVTVTVAVDVPPFPSLMV